MKPVALIALYLMTMGGCMQQGTGKPQTADVAGTLSSGNAKAQIEYIIFGRYCGRCISGKCSPMYKVDYVNKKLTFDNSSNYSQGKPLTFTVELADEKFKLVDKLDSALPDSLFLTDKKRFGCPDCADQCGMYLEIKTPLKKYEFELDNRISGMNGFIVNLATQLRELISQLSSER